MMNGHVPEVVLLTGIRDVPLNGLLGCASVVHGVRRKEGSPFVGCVETRTECTLVIYRIPRVLVQS